MKKMQERMGTRKERKCKTKEEENRNKNENGPLPTIFTLTLCDA